MKQCARLHTVRPQLLSSLLCTSLRFSSLLFYTLLFASLPLVVPAHATVIHVDVEGGGDHATIGPAVGAAAEGDTVLVAPGVYRDPSDYNIDFSSKNLTLASEAGPATTIIDCELLDRAFIFHSGETPSCIIDGFTIVNGRAIRGGGMYIEGSSPTLRNLLFSQNEATSGGLYCIDGSAPTVYSCTFDGNDAWIQGEGLFCYGGSSPNVERCAFVNNAAGRKGGGAFAAGSFPVFTVCTFDGNSVALSDEIYEGGAIHCTESSVLELRSSTLVLNRASYGGGIYFDATSTGAVDNIIIAHGPDGHAV